MATNKNRAPRSVPTLTIGGTENPAPLMTEPSLSASNRRRKGGAQAAAAPKTEVSSLGSSGRRRHDVVTGHHQRPKKKRKFARKMSRIWRTEEEQLEQMAKLKVEVPSAAEKMTARKAAACVRDAIKGEPVYEILQMKSANVTTGFKPWNLAVHRWQSNLGSATPILVTCLLLLGLYERPTWCWNAASSNECQMRPDGEVIPTATLPIWEPVASSLIELLLLALVGIEHFFRARLLSWAEYRKEWHRPVELILLIVGFVDVIFNFIVPSRRVRISVWLRPFQFAFGINSVRQISQSFQAAIPSLLMLVLLQAIFVVFMAFCGVLLFTDVAGDNYFGSLGRSTYDLIVLMTVANYPDIAIPVLNQSLGYTVYFAIFVLISTFLILNLVLSSLFSSYQQHLTHQEKMALQYKRAGLTQAFCHLSGSQQPTPLPTNSTLSPRNPLAAIAAAPLGLPSPRGGLKPKIAAAAAALRSPRGPELYLPGLTSPRPRPRTAAGVGALSPRGLKSPRTAVKTPRGGKTSRGGSAANDGPGITFSQFFWMVTELNAYWWSPTIKLRQARLYFTSVDIDNNGKIDMDEFLRLVEAFELHFIERSKLTPLQLKLASSPSCGGTGRGSGGGDSDGDDDGGDLEPNHLPSWYQRLTTFVLSIRYDLLVTLVVVANVVLTIVEVSVDGLVFGGAYEIVFICLYVLDILLKMFAYGGFRRFWNDFDTGLFNRFDMLLTLASAGVEVYSIGGTVSPFTTRILLICRMARLFRTFRIIRTFRLLASTFASIAKVLVPVAGVVVFIFAFFALVFMEAFGGQVYRSNPALVGTAYEAGDYYSLNFNDYGSSLATLFALMLVNNWFIFTDAFTALSGVAAWRVAFVLYYFAAVVFALSVVVAAVLDRFEKQYETLQKDELEGLDETLLTGFQEGIGGVSDNKKLIVRRRRRD